MKYINDSLGGAVCDRLLQPISKGRMNCVRTTDMASRQ
jgi:PleD family two-component response regulator